MDVFVQSEQFGSVPQVLQSSILIVWTQLRVESLRILSTDPHLALLGTNLSVIRLQMTLSEEFWVARNHWYITMFIST